MSPKWPSRAWRQGLRWFAGCLLLLLSGLFILQRAEQLGVTAELTWLGQTTLAPGAPAAQRAWALDPEGKRLPLTAARLSLRRGERRALLCSLGALQHAREPSEVMDLNFRVPEWPAGSARMLLELESADGPLRMEREVMLDPLIRGNLSLWPPSRELRASPAGIATGPVGGREGMVGNDGPVAFQVFPLGGRLMPDGDQAWVRAVDRQGRSLRGTVRSGDRQERGVDEEGLALLPVGVAEGLHFQSPGGQLDQRLELVSEAAPGRLRAKRMLVQAGERLPLRLDGLAERTRLHWELWWLGGWGAGGQVELEAGGGDLEVDLPAGIEGPVLLRLRRRPEGDDAPARAFALMGAQGAPRMDEAWRLLRLTPGADGFAEEMAGLGQGSVALAAHLSRLRGPGNALPELGRDSSRGKRPAMRSLGWGLAGAGGLGLLALALWVWLRVRRGRRVDPGEPNP